MAARRRRRTGRPRVRSCSPVLDLLAPEQAAPQAQRIAPEARPLALVPAVAALVLARELLEQRLERQLRAQDEYVLTVAVLARHGVTARPVLCRRLQRILAADHGLRICRRRLARERQRFAH